MKMIALYRIVSILFFIGAWLSTEVMQARFAIVMGFICMVLAEIYDIHKKLDRVLAKSERA